MNIQQEERAIRNLPPQKYTIRILVIAVCTLFSGYPTMWAILNKKYEEGYQQYQQCMVEKQQMSEQRRVEEQQRADERIKQADQDKRKADSILNIVVTAQSSMKKAISDEKHKR